MARSMPAYLTTRIETGILCSWIYPLFSFSFVEILTLILLFFEKGDPAHDLPVVEFDGFFVNLLWALVSLGKAEGSRPQSLMSSQSFEPLRVWWVWGHVRLREVDVAIHTDVAVHRGLVKSWLDEWFWFCKQFCFCACFLVSGTILVSRIILVSNDYGTLKPWFHDSSWGPRNLGVVRYSMNRDTFVLRGPRWPRMTDFVALFTCVWKCNPF